VIVVIQRAISAAPGRAGFWWAVCCPTSPRI